MFAVKDQSYDIVFYFSAETLRDGKGSHQSHLNHGSNHVFRISHSRLATSLSEMIHPNVFQKHKETYKTQTCLNSCPGLWYRICSFCHMGNKTHVWQVLASRLLASLNAYARSGFEASLTYPDRLLEKKPPK